MNNYVDCGRLQELEGAAKATITYSWTPALIVDSRGFGKDDGSGTRRFIFFESVTGSQGKLGISASNGEVSYAITNQFVICAGKRYIASMVFDGTQAVANDRLKLYLDGVRITDLGYNGGLMPTTLPSISNDFTFGTRLANFMAGNGESIRVDLKALTPRQIGILHGRIRKAKNL